MGEEAEAAGQREAAHIQQNPDQRSVLLEAQQHPAPEIPVDPGEEHWLLDTSLDGSVKIFYFFLVEFWKVVLF